MRLIDADEVIKHLEKCIADPMFDNDYRKICFAICKYIDDVPTIEAEPVKHGRWLICCDGYYPYCSSCKKEPQGRGMTGYCPNCGARMDGDT